MSLFYTKYEPKYNPITLTKTHIPDILPKIILTSGEQYDLFKFGNTCIANGLHYALHLDVVHRKPSVQESFWLYMRICQRRIHLFHPTSKPNNTSHHSHYGRCQFTRTCRLYDRNQNGLQAQLDESRSSKPLTSHGWQFLWNRPHNIDK